MSYRSILASLLATDQIFLFGHKLLYNNHRILTMMAKKPEKAVSKKECPSCGLGINPELAVCEFCGWDFQEEDEWILQIEKLERDLMLEKQKFEPGTVNHLIESTLRSPAFEQAEKSVPADEEAIDIGEEAEREKAVPAETSPEPEKVRRIRSVRTPPPTQEKPPPPQPAPERKAAEVPVRKAEGPPTETPSPVPERKVRTIASPPAPAKPEEASPVRRTRVVRKVKQ
jgi:hypothetical protein